MSKSLYEGLVSGQEMIAHLLWGECAHFVCLLV